MQRINPQKVAIDRDRENAKCLQKSKNKLKKRKVIGHTGRTLRKKLGWGGVNGESFLRCQSGVTVLLFCHVLKIITQDSEGEFINRWGGEDTKGKRDIKKIIASHTYIHTIRLHRTTHSTTATYSHLRTHGTDGGREGTLGDGIGEGEGG